MSAGLAAFKLAFELSPIILTGGLVGSIPGMMMPIMAITEAVNLPLGLLGGTGGIELDDFFAHYSPMPGATMIDQEIATYPFANQTIAANSVITKPLMISYAMIVPAKGPAGMFTKLPIMMMLQKALEYHNSHGGTYTLLTPSFIYTNCVMLAMRDISGGATMQVQNTWQLDFVKPLLTVNDAQGLMGSQNGLMSQLTGGTQLDAVGGSIPTSGLDIAGGAGIPPTEANVTPVIGGANQVGVAQLPVITPAAPPIAPGVPALPSGPLSGGGV